ncbi:MAG TPA: beta-N-acetylglucosaminidase domain-containing protein [Kutzneria sp.]|nr:beta-N-acetylglucosaminidase domain-containing protein [Kutzneria sp.]
MSRHVVCALSVLLLGIGLAMPPASAAGTAREAVPNVYPTPQSIQRHGDRVTLTPSMGLVTRPDSDPAAVRVIRETLQANGVRQIDDKPQPGEPTVLVDDAAALAGLGVQDAGGLPDEGYVLADGQLDGRPVIVLDGHDAAGTFYAAQTLRQLAVRGEVPAVAIRDWPSYRTRGVVEGFYGTPWSNAARADQFDFDGRHKLNTYVYTPKDDPYLRARWRDQYPPDQLAQLKALVGRAIANHVDFTYAVSPGLSVCYSSAADEQALVAKLQSLWDVGVRTFAVPLDDISYTKWNCDADQARFGDGGAAAGAAQSLLLNEVQHDFIATHPGAARLEMVPTEYYDLASSPYKDTLKAQLDPSIVVEWTGAGVIATTITADQAAAAKAVFGHDILVWDNYPVNDYTTNRLLLGPYTGRQAGLASSLYGITANPMIQPVASDIALFGVADFTWNDQAYDPQRSWQAGLNELAGPSLAARQAMDAFADLEHYSLLNPVQAPVLAGRIAAFWPAWENGDNTAADLLDTYLRAIESIPSDLADAAFVAEARPWVDSAGTWGQAARAALRMLVDQRNDQGAAAVADRAQVRALAAKAASYQYVGLNGTVNVSVGDGVIDAFVTAALAENDRWLGLAGRRPAADISMPAYLDHTPVKTVDGDDSTYFWSSRPPSDGDHVGVDLGVSQPVTAVTVTMSKSDSPDDYLHSGVLEYSGDGRGWQAVQSFAGTTTVHADLPAGTTARYIRLRATGTQTNWVVVREFAVTGPGIGPLPVTGAPAGSNLAAAADGNADTAYTAGSSPASGDALVVGLPGGRALSAVEVVGHAAGTVQVHQADGWRSLGALADGYTQLSAHQASADAIRLLWTPGSPPPTIAEVVPRYADAGVAVNVVPLELDVQLGQPGTLTVNLSSLGLDDQHDLLVATPPRGLRITPMAGLVSVPRGAQPSRNLTVTSLSVGTYQVPIAFGARKSAVVVRVHPETGANNVALASAGAVATASSTEAGLPQFTPDHAIDGDAATRWSSNYTDGEWLQVQLGRAQQVGKVVVQWELAHANAYQIQTSPDGTTWTTAATVADSQGGVETVWLDQNDVRYLRMQGVSRSTRFGYSIFEFRVYPAV